MRAFVDLLVTFNSGPSDSGAELKRSPDMTQQLVYGRDGPRMYVSRPAAGDCVAVLNHVACTPWKVWGIGEVFDHSENTQREEACLASFASHLASKRAKPEQLNGHFLLLARNDESCEWHVWTDRFGTVHAYHAANGQKAAIGTFFPAVAAAASQRHLDWVGLTGFFSFGFFPQDRTYFEDSRILRPASHYVFDDDGRLLRRERYWQWWHLVDQRRSYEDTVGEFGLVLNRVLADETRDGQIAVPISGGLDSRTVVAVIDQVRERPAFGERLWSYSYGYSDDSVETRIARRVAEARDLPFQSFTIRPCLFDRLDLISASVEGFQDITQCRQATVVDRIANQADYLIAAHWGDVWLDDMGLTVGLTKNGRSKRPADDGHVLSHMLHKLEKRGAGWLVEHLCQPRLGDDSPEHILREMVREDLSGLKEIEDADFRLKAFKTDQWSFRWTATGLRMFQPAALPRLPFYDTRMADFFCTVPSEFVSKRRLQIDFLKRFAPDLARITWQAYDADLFNYEHFGSWLLPKRAFKRASRLLTGKRTAERNWEVQLLNDSGRAGLEQWLARPGLLLHDFVSPARVRDLIDAFYATPLEQGRGYTVPMLLTFSAWLERYG